MLFTDSVKQRWKISNGPIFQLKADDGITEPAIEIMIFRSTLNVRTVSICGYSTCIPILDASFQEHIPTEKSG
jgi:hypothetical protein